MLPNASSGVRAWIRWLDLDLDEKTLCAALYLEKHGQRFGIDFGYQNAVELARQHWRERRRKRKA